MYFNRLNHAVKCTRARFNTLDVVCACILAGVVWIVDNVQLHIVLKQQLSQTIYISHTPRVHSFERAEKARSTHCRGRTRPGFLIWWSPRWRPPAWPIPAPRRTDLPSPSLLTFWTMARCDLPAGANQWSHQFSRAPPSVMTELDIINTHVHDGGAALSASRCSNNNNDDDDDDDAVKNISLKTFSIKGGKCIHE